MYVFIEVARTTEGTRGLALTRDILALEPQLLNYLTEVVARLRWDDGVPGPLTKTLLLAWKAVRVTLGGQQDVEDVKAALGRLENLEAAETVGNEETTAAVKNNNISRGQSIIAASPLDYHLFRQEVVNCRFTSVPVYCSLLSCETVDVQFHHPVSCREMIYSALQFLCASCRSQLLPQSGRKISRDPAPGSSHEYLDRADLLSVAT